MRSNIFASIGRTAALLVSIGLLFAAFLLLARPWYSTWGSSVAESGESLPGDELLQAKAQTTRAVTVRANAQVVWAWVAQLGQDRGGFYSYEILENLVGARMRNVDELRPELQTWKVGDKLWMYPPDKLGGAGHALLLQIDPGRALVFGTRQIGTATEVPPDGTWTFVVRPIDADHTRLIARSRAAGQRSPVLRMFDLFVFEPTHFVMERKMLEGIKARAEGRAPSPTADLLEAGAFFACFVLFVAASVRLVRWPDALPELFMVLATGVTFQLLTFLQPPWVVGAIAVLVLGFYVGGGSLTARRRPDVLQSRTA